MNAMRECLRWTVRILSGALQAIDDRRRALSEHFRFGIAFRQVAAFICVGALVLAGNFIFERGVLIEKTTEVTRLPPAPAVPPKPVARAPDPPVVSEAPAVAPERHVLPRENLLLALDRYERAVQQRSSADTEQSEAAYQQASADLDQESDAFIAQVTAVSGKSLPKLAASIKTYRQHGEALVSMADQRHELLNQYSTLFEQLYARVNDSLKGAWKVFGRVVARQSLLQLSADLDELRRSAAALGTADSADSPAIEPLLNTEQVVAKSLEANEKSLKRSEGDAWYTAMREDFARLMTVRQSIMELNAPTRQHWSNVSQETTSLAALVPNKIDTPPPPPLKMKIVSLDKVGRLVSVQLPTIFVTAAAATPAVIETHSVTTRAPQDYHKRTLIAWLSVGVLVLLVSITLGTVLSIVRPVRRLRDATTRLAHGETAVRVPRGGIRELDTLAVAFNAMADELTIAKAAAQNYQESLEAKVAERTEQLQDLAEHDPLTGLPNRREFFALLNAAIGRAGNDSYHIGVLFLDVDNFKYLNDSMGHAFGDRVLVSLAQRLLQATRAFGFAARLGGDEFTVVLERAASIEDISAAGRAVVQAFQRPLSVDGRDFIVSVSVGASIYPEHDRDPEALLKAADAALFRAKALGRGQLSVFTPELLEAAAAKFTTEQGLRRAIERDEFELMFQPEVNVDTLETALVEALLRWRMPDGTLATPDQFLAVAEESGLIMEISDWVLRSAIAAASHWYHGAWPEARVAINVSPRLLFDNHLVDRLTELLREYRLPARCIEIELTESVLQTGPATIAALQSLRSHGVAIALDDFGSGYSSLASLEQLPLTRVKLDRSLIAGIDTNARSAAIARAIVDMCHGLGLEITAEGVERPEQFALLLSSPGMYLQGYLLSHPVARDDVLSARVNVNRRAHELLLRSQLSRPPTRVELKPPRLHKLTEAG
ncbi:MAG: GGDEF domain-containing protein [Steroidobacteraceae bacterium]|jgi:diguanylate cyclase (GGDEF)-like protein